MVAGHKTSAAGRGRRESLVYSRVRACHFDPLFDLRCRSDPKSRSSHRNLHQILPNHLHRPCCSWGCWLAGSGSSTAGAGQVDWLHFFCPQMAVISWLTNAFERCCWCLDLSWSSHLGFLQQLYFDFGYLVQRPLNCSHQTKHNFSCTSISLTPKQQLITAPRYC